MAENYTTEEQEIEAVKKWWAENGLAIGLGLVIGLGGLFGYRGYKAHQEEQAIAASDLYSAMIIQTRQQEMQTATDLADKIISEYQNTDYAVFSSFILAKFAIEKADYTAAKKHLEFAKDNASSEQLESLANLRLARVAFAEEDYAATLKLLNNVDEQGYEAAIAELKGDVFSRQDDLAKARDEYAVALSKTEVDAGNYQILEMKLDSVGH